LEANFAENFESLEVFSIVMMFASFQFAEKLI
jgi:hypothetical protein